jgi:hypothetical protein
VRTLSAEFESEVFDREADMCIVISLSKLHFGRCTHTWMAWLSSNPERQLRVAFAMVEFVAGPDEIDVVVTVKTT